MTTSVDGRTTRWAEHNAQRRRELVEATLRAIRRRGHGIGMDELAAEAGTSKTVFYRHFGDRAGLYAAMTPRMTARPPSREPSDAGSAAALVRSRMIVASTRSATAV